MKFNPSSQSYGSTASAASVATQARYTKRAEAAARLQAIACGPPSSGNPPCPVDLPPIPRGERGSMIQDAPPDPWAAERKKYQQEWDAYLNQMVELPDGQWVLAEERKWRLSSAFLLAAVAFSPFLLLHLWKIGRSR